MILIKPKIGKPPTSAVRTESALRERNGFTRRSNHYSGMSVHDYFGHLEACQRFLNNYNDLEKYHVFATYLT